MIWKFHVGLTMQRCPGFQVFSGFFDYSTGSKTDKASYTKIATEIGCDPSKILYLTDLPEGELEYIQSVCDVSV